MCIYIFAAGRSVNGFIKSVFVEVTTAEKNYFSLILTRARALSLSCPLTLSLSLSLSPSPTLHLTLSHCLPLLTPRRRCRRHRHRRRRQSSSSFFFFRGRMGKCRPYTRAERNIVGGRRRGAGAGGRPKNVRARCSASG